MASDSKQALHKFEKQLTAVLFNDSALGLKGSQTSRIVEIAKSAAEATVVSANGKAPPEEVASKLRVANLTDMGNAECLALLYGDTLRFCHTRQEWLVWDGERWLIDADSGAHRLMVETVRSRYKSGADLDGEKEPERKKKYTAFTVTSENSRNVRNALVAAQALQGFATTIEDWDAEPMLANAGPVTIDLNTGQARPTQREDYITRRLGAAYNPQAACPRWERFLDEIFGGNRELVAFVQRAIGYSLTGDTSEQKLFLCYGTGANGKSVLLSTLGRLLGDYAGSTSFDTFDADNDRARGDLAKLKGARVVTVIESDEDKRLNEARVKAVTGCDLVTAEAKFKDPFTYKPTYKLWLAMNHKPTIRGTDLGIWRRIQLIPFEQSFDERSGRRPDKQLENKLVTELSGILNWAVAGLREWHQQGLNPPAAVLNATDQYREESDLIGQWLEACTVKGRQMETKAGDAYKSYQAWCADTGARALTMTAWGRRLAEKGLPKVKRGSYIFYGGIGIASKDG